MEDSIESLEKSPQSTPQQATNNFSIEVQKLLRKTLSLGRMEAAKQATFFNQQCKLPQKNKSLPKIMLKMNRNRADLQTTMYKNHGKLNSSFSGYLQSEMSLARDELRKKKITKFKKVEEKGVTLIEAPPVDRDQNSYLDLNLRMNPLVNRCFDSLFPAIRYNATLLSCEKQVYLLGGYHQNAGEGLSLFHSYDLEGKKWVQVKAQGEVPKATPCFHTVEVYRNNMVILGGISLEGGQKGKRFNTQLLIYNMERGEWLKARAGGVSLKNHASTLFGSTLMISGGINQKERYSEDIYFITFTGGNILNPLIFGVHNNSEFHQKIAHHKIVNTYEIQGNLRNHIKYEGVFSFGGQNQQGVLNNDLTFINVLGKGGQNLDIKFKRWELISTNDDRPMPRKDHSFSVINKKAIAVLAGGIDEQGTWLTDVWLFDFVRLNWTRVTTSPSIPESIGYLAGHCTCTVGSSVYFYNGNVQKKREKAFWCLQTDATVYKSKKTIYSTKLPSFKSFVSNKENMSISKI